MAEPSQRKDNWGKKRLAYPDRQGDFGLYVVERDAWLMRSARRSTSILNITDVVLNSADDMTAHRNH